MEGLNFRLKDLRQHLKLTNADFARELDLKSSYISIYELGKSQPGAEIIERIVRRFNVNANWLLTGEGDMFLNGRVVNVKASESKLFAKSQGKVAESGEHWYQELINRLYKELDELRLKNEQLVKC